MVNERPRSGLVEKTQRCVPGLTALRIRVGADGDTADAQAAEEQRRGVELRGFTGQTPDDADASMVGT